MFLCREIVIFDLFSLILFFHWCSSRISVWLKFNQNNSRKYGSILLSIMTDFEIISTINHSLPICKASQTSIIKTIWKCPLVVLLQLIIPQRQMASTNWVNYVNIKNQNDVDMVVKLQEKKSINDGLLSEYQSSFHRELKQYEKIIEILRWKLTES